MSSHSGPLLLGLTLHQLAWTVTADDRHICKRIMAGQFDKINISSITYDAYEPKIFGFGDAQELRIYETGDRLYRILLKDVQDNSVDMSGAKVESYSADGGNRKNQFAKSIKGSGVSQGDLTSVYHWRLKSWHVPAIYKHAFLFTTKNYRKMYQITTPWFSCCDKTKWTKPAGFYPDELALVHNQKGNTNQMYAIHRDQYDGTKDFIIYQIWLLKENLELDSLQVVDANAEEKAAAWYWYLEKTVNPSEVKLANRKKKQHKHDPEYQLFSKLPVGFMHYTNGQLYLFDQALGCVYRFDSWNEETLNRERMEKNQFQDLFFHRINIPYERYFNCDLKQYPKSADFEQKHMPDRCETHSGTKAANAQVHTNASFDSRSESWINAGVSILLLVLVISGLIFLFTRKSKRDKSKKKVDSMTSTDGTSEFKFSKASSAVSDKPSLLNSKLSPIKMHASKTPLSFKGKGKRDKFKKKIGSETSTNRTSNRTSKFKRNKATSSRKLSVSKQSPAFMRSSTAVSGKPLRFDLTPRTSKTPAFFIKR